MTDPSDALIEALEVFERWRSQGGRDPEALLQRHESLRVWLEPLVHDESREDRTSGGEVTASHDHLLRRVRLRADAPEGAHRYEVGDEIARGGMGAILRTFDRDLRRTLAMKVAVDATSPGSGTPQSGSLALDRFLAEAQVTSQLEHPGVVPVHDIGIDEQGRVYFTMALVRGDDLGDIFERLRDGHGKWTRTRVLGVLQKVCDTLAYAHSKGVIHRDLKPRNVMVGEFGEVYVMDWGLARIAATKEQPASSETIATDRHEDDDSPLLTQMGQVVGTPAYMAPEQADGDLAALGPTVDVYAIGAVLYELLAGHPPYVTAGDRTTPQRVLERLRQAPPTAIEQLAGDAPAELLSICRRAMARAPGDRYADVGALGDDLRAFLEGRVVQAHRTGSWVELRAWIRRNRRLSAVGLLLVLTLVLGLTATMWQASVASRTARREREAREVADGQRLSALSVSLADKSPTLALQLAVAGAERAPPSLSTNRALYRAIERHVEVATLHGHEGGVHLIATSATGRWMTSTDHTGLQILWNARTGELLHRWDEHDVIELDSDPLGERRRRRSVTAIGFSPNEELAFSAGYDGTLRLWDVATGARRRVLELPSPIGSAVFGPRGQMYAGTVDGAVRVYDVSTGALVDEVARHDGPVRLLVRGGNTVVSCAMDHTAWVARLEEVTSKWRLTLSERPSETSPPDRPSTVPKASISDDGTRVMSSCRGQLRAWDLGDGSLPPRPLPLPTETGLRGQLSGNGDWAYLGPAPDRRSRRVYDFQQDRLINLPSDGAGSTIPRFSPDGRLLLLTKTVWDLDTGQLVSQLAGHANRVPAAGWLDANRVVTGGADRTVRIWDFALTPRLSGLRDHRIAIAPDGTSGIALSATHVMQKPMAAAPSGLIDLRTGTVLNPLDGGEPPVRAWFDPTGRYLAMPRDRRFSVFDLDAKRLALDVEVRAGGVQAGLSCDGIVAVMDGNRDRRLRLFDLETGALLPASRNLPEREARAVSFSPDGDRFVVANSNENVATVWSTRDGTLIHTFVGLSSMAVDVAYSPDGSRIAVSSIGALHVFQADEFGLQQHFDGLRAGGRLRWSPDSRLLTFTGSGRTLLDIESGEVLMDWPEHKPVWLHATRFSEDGASLIAATRPGLVDVLPVDPFRRARALLPREMSAQEMARFAVGTPAQRRARDREQLASSNTTRGLSQRARLALDDGQLDAASAFLDLAKSCRPRGPVEPIYYTVRAQALCRAAESGERSTRDVQLGEALTAMQAAVRFGLRREEVLALPDIEPLRGLPAFREWVDKLR